MKKKLLIALATLLWAAACVFANEAVLVINPTTKPVPVTGEDISLVPDMTHVISVPGATPSPSPAQALTVQGIASAIPLNVSGGVTVSGAAVAPVYAASHITTKTTTTVTSSTAYVSSIAICVTGAGTSQTLVIQDKSGTAKTLYTAGSAIAVGNTYINFERPVLMSGGIDIVTGGTTAGTQDVFITYFQ